MLINRLKSGGLITNYYCTSKCRHCLYKCSPMWPKHYIRPQMAEFALRTSRKYGCYSLHIGGGEPFLNPKALEEVASLALEQGVQIEYIETNASWCIHKDRVKKRLERLLKLAVNTLLVSVSPFHLEYIPLQRIYTLVSASEEVGMGLFLWTRDFLEEFSSLDPTRCYRLEELERIFGPGYIENISNRYWIHPGGRALDHFFKGSLTVNEIMDMFPTGCRELEDTSHFHIDLYGHYIPGLCAGLAMAASDLGSTILPDKYPLLTILYEQGIKGLFVLASSKGFGPKRKTYSTRCHLCTEIRSFFLETGGHFHELAPLEHYK